MNLRLITLATLTLLGSTTFAAGDPSKACEDAKKALNLPASSETLSATHLRRVAPVYPPAARKNGTQGCVLLVYDETSDGQARNIRVAKVEPENAGFRESALLAFAKWEFEKREAKDKYTIIGFALE